MGNVGGTYFIGVVQSDKLKIFFGVLWLILKKKTDWLTSGLDIALCCSRRKVKYLIGCWVWMQRIRERIWVRWRWRGRAMIPSCNYLPINVPTIHCKNWALFTSRFGLTWFSEICESLPVLWLSQRNTLRLYIKLKSTKSLHKQLPSLVGVFLNIPSIFFTLLSRYSHLRSHLLSTCSRCRN